MTRNKASFIPAFGFRWLTPVYEPLLQLVMPYRVRTAPIVEAVRSHGGSSDVLLDVGCGTGLLLRTLGDLAEQLIGVDIDPAVLRIAEKKEIPKLQLFQCSACALPLEDNSVDIAVSRLMSHHLTHEEKQMAFREAHRVLTPGGLFVLADFGKPRNAFYGVLALAMRFGHSANRVGDNLGGLVPKLVEEAGLSSVKEVSHSGTLFGTFRVIAAQKT